MTDKDAVTEFVEQRDVGILAVSIGNVHARYEAPPPC